jgi:hypothetical protein
MDKSKNILPFRPLYSVYMHTSSRLAKAYGIKCGAIGNILGEHIKELHGNLLRTQWEHNGSTKKTKKFPQKAKTNKSWKSKMMQMYMTLLIQVLLAGAFKCAGNLAASTCEIQSPWR